MMDLKYLSLEGEAAVMKEVEEISEHDCNDEEDRRKSSNGKTVPKLVCNTAKDCVYCLGRIIAYTTYVSRRKLVSSREE